MITIDRTNMCSHLQRKLYEENGIRTIWSDFFVDNPASGRVLEKCGFRDTGEINYCSRLQLGSDRPVKVMKLEIQ